MISFTCDNCDSRLQVDDEYAGARVKCPGCGYVNTVPREEPKPRGGRAWRRTEPPAETPRPGREPSGGLAARLDGLVAHLTARPTDRDQTQLATGLHNLAALAAAAILIGTLAFTASGVIELLGRGSGGPIQMLWPVGWLGVGVWFLAGLGAALTGYMFAASSCRWLRTQTATLCDPTMLRGAMVVSLLAAIALLIVAGSAVALDRDFATAIVSFLAAAFAASAAFIFYAPGVVGIAVAEGERAARWPVFASGLALLETLAKLVLALGVVGFALSGALTLVGWVGALGGSLTEGATIERFGLWGSAAGQSGILGAATLPLAGYLFFFVTNLCTGVARAELAIAEHLTQTAGPPTPPPPQDEPPEAE